MSEVMLDIKNYSKSYGEGKKGGVLFIGSRNSNSRTAAAAGIDMAAVKSPRRRFAATS